MGKVEKANGELKEILNKLIFDQPNSSYEALLDQAVFIYNRRVGPNGYSRFYLMFGTKPPTEQQIYSSYEREHLPSEDKSFAAELARIHAAPLARIYVASLKSARDQTRAYPQEDKALIRVYGTRDWVLRVRSRKHKHEPFYDGPWQITKSRSGNTYSLASPGGIVLSNRYNGSRLFPAYVHDGHPVRSFWYGSKTLLENDRKRLHAAVEAEGNQSMNRHCSSGKGDSEDPGVPAVGS